MPSLDAAWTDAVLTLSCYGGALWAVSRDRTRVLGPAGLFVVGLAAMLGTVRLAGNEALGPMHDGLSALGGLVGVPLIGLGVVLGPRGRGWGTVAAAAAVVGLVVISQLGAEPTRTLRTALSGAAMVGCLGIGAWRRDPWPIVGALGVLGAGLGIAGEGSWFGFDRMGWFHLVMAGAMAALARGSRPRATLKERKDTL